MSLSKIFCSCKSVFVQKYLRAIFPPRAILYARTNLTATPLHIPKIKIKTIPVQKFPLVQKCLCAILSPRADLTATLKYDIIVIK